MRQVQGPVFTAIFDEGNEERGNAVAHQLDADEEAAAADFFVFRGRWRRSLDSLWMPSIYGNRILHLRSVGVPLPDSRRGSPRADNRPRALPQAFRGLGWAPRRHCGALEALGGAPHPRRGPPKGLGGGPEGESTRNRGSVEGSMGEAGRHRAGNSGASVENRVPSRVTPSILHGCRRALLRGPPRDFVRIDASPGDHERS